MKYENIRNFSQRCEEHPDHQSGMISHQMLLDRAHEEIDELREYIEQAQKQAPVAWVGLTDEDISEIVRGTHNTLSFVRAIEAKLKEKNT